MLPKQWAVLLGDAIKDFLLDLEFCEDEEDAVWSEELEVPELPLPPPQGRWAEKYRRMIEER